MSTDVPSAPKLVDLLDEDPPIAGQKYGVFSFITPQKVLKQKEMFFFEEFVKQWSFVKSISKFMDFLNYASFKYGIKLELLMNDYEEFLKEESAKLKEDTNIETDYKNFIDKYEDKLTEKFQRANQFQTSVFGIKERGNFATEEEAKEHAKKVRERDPHHNVYVGPIGVWMPIDPDPHRTKAVEYLETELNQLHHEKLKNEEKAREEFDRRVKEAKRKAIQENIDLAQKTGNRLTQTIDPQGNLIGVPQTVDFESREVADPDVGKQLFDKMVADANAKKID